MDNLSSKIRPTTTSSTLHSSLSPLNVQNKLRKIAILTYKLQHEEIFKSLWTSYWKSGVGELNINHQGPSIWPMKIKAMIKTRATLNKNENDTCIALVQDRLSQFNIKIQRYETELQTQLEYFGSDREIITSNMDTYIREKLERFQRKIDHEIALVQYDHNDRLLELEFLKQQPSEYCVSKYSRKIVFENI